MNPNCYDRRRHPLFLLSGCIFLLWRGKGNVLFGIGGDFFWRRRRFEPQNVEPQNIEPQNVGPWHSSGAGEGEENIEVMVILSDSCVFDLFFGDRMDCFRGTCAIRGAGGQK